MAIWSRPTVKFSVFGPIAAADLRGLQARLAMRIRDRGVPAVIDCTLVDVHPDAVAVDALAQLTLCARRGDCELRVRNPPAELRELTELAGLDDVLRFGSQPSNCSGSPNSGNSASTSRKNVISAIPPSPRRST